MTFSQFEFVEVSTLPQLAWCAVVTSGRKTVLLYHGTHVERWERGFIEGAWDGDFREKRFCQAPVMIGTGGCFEEGRLIFAPPTNACTFLSLVRTETELFISNSTCFALALAGDRPAVRYPDYGFDLLHSRRLGLSQLQLSLPTENGNRLTLAKWHSFQVRDDRAIDFIERRPVSAPTCFQSFVSQMKRSMAAVLENAASHERRIRYQGLASVSRGYDCNAMAALARGDHCDTALTLSGLTEVYGDLDDGGQLVAEALGYEVKEFSRSEYLEHPGLPESEFAAASSKAGAVPLLAAEELLRSRVLVTGNIAENYWGLDPLDDFPNLICPEAETLSGTSDMDFRLRAGYLQFSPAYIMGGYQKTLRTLSESPEMKPWSIGTEYDRPIPRRILEDAGVPRESFGQTKIGGLHAVSFHKGSAQDFESFYDSLAVPHWFRSSPRFQLPDLPDLFIGLLRKLSLLYLPCFRAATPILLSSNRRCKRVTEVGAQFNHPFGWRCLYLYHWGFARISDRYRV